MDKTTKLMALLHIYQYGNTDHYTHEIAELIRDKYIIFSDNKTIPFKISEKGNIVINSVLRCI
jgi:hypothetical protein